MRNTMSIACSIILALSGCQKKEGEGSKTSQNNPDTGENSVEPEAQGNTPDPIKDDPSQTTASVGTLAIFSNLQKMDSSGNLTSVVAEGNPTSESLAIAGAVALAIPDSSGTALTEEVGQVSKILTKAGGQIFILFKSPQTLRNEQDCLLAKVEPDGKPSCVDSSLASIYWEGLKNPAVQFDSEDGIYYFGTSKEGNTVLRRFKNGQISDLVNDNVTLKDFYVLNSGTVILMGESSTGAKWLRTIAPTGGLKTISATQDQSFLMPFPDGNIYFGGIKSSEISWGIFKIDAATNTLDPKPWVAQASASPSFECLSTYPYGFRGYCGASITKSFPASDKLYAIAGWAGETAFMKYYPTVEEVLTGLASVTNGIAIGQKLVLTGLDSNGVNKIAIMNLADEAGAIVASDDEFEVYSMVTAGDNEILFNALRFSDNKTVVGKLTISPATLSVLNVDAFKFSAFERIK